MGTGRLFECSNQGTCDRRTGMCRCLGATAGGGNFPRVAYRALPSDGRGNPGSLPDCGFLERNNVGCLPLSDGGSPSGSGSASNIDYSDLGGWPAQPPPLCSGHGVCSNTTGLCECFASWGGASCGVAQCPSGPAWFDEASSASTAHAPAECSNMGNCDRTSGLCICREGFTGPACEYKDCPRHPDTGEACSGHGYCESLSSLFALHSLSYGDATHPAWQPQAWDAAGWHECVCYSRLGLGAGAFGHPLRPATGARSDHSGWYGGALPLPGWGNWDCSRRLCPRGE